MTPDAEQNEKVKASISCGEVEDDENVTAHSIRPIATKKMVPIKKYLPKSVTMQHIGSQVSLLQSWEVLSLGANVVAWWNGHFILGPTLVCSQGS